MSLGSFSAPENEHKYFIAQQIGGYIFSDKFKKVIKVPLIFWEGNKNCTYVHVPNNIGDYPLRTYVHEPKNICSLKKGRNERIN